MRGKLHIHYRMRVETDIDRYYTHFSERLRERYDVGITMGDYVNLWRRQETLFHKSSLLNIVKVRIEEEDIFCLYWKRVKIMKTCYPHDVESNIRAMIRSCFGSRLQEVASSIYWDYLRECSELPDTKYSRERALFILENTKFPILHFRRLQEKMDMWFIMKTIQRIIEGECTYSKIQVVKR